VIPEINKQTKQYFQILKDIYAIYDDAIRNEPVACQLYCTTCCTLNVTLTSLEGGYILTYLKNNNQSDHIQSLYPASSQNRFQPKQTINHMASETINHNSFSEETIPDTNAECPFLSQSRCTIYPVRPFACRCMRSIHQCDTIGYAEMSPLLLSINTLFQQFIEHMDHTGFFGNMIDVLLYMKEYLNYSQYPYSIKDLPSNLIRNKPAKSFIISNDHIDDIEPIYNRLQQLL